MQIPNEVTMAKVDAREVDELNPLSGWMQHHRNEELHVGCVSKSFRRGAPTIQTWYCDYLINQTFNTLQDMQRAALVVPEVEAAKLLSAYPMLAEVVPITEPSAGHAKPSCSIHMNEPATHCAVLVRSWFNEWNTTVFLGKKAMERTKKKEPLNWVSEALRTRRGVL